jgi:hypothetical protein
MGYHLKTIAYLGKQVRTSQGTGTITAETKDYVDVTMDAPPHRVVIVKKSALIASHG